VCRRPKRGPAPCAAVALPRLTPDVRHEQLTIRGKGERETFLATAEPPEVTLRQERVQPRGEVRFQARREQLALPQLRRSGVAEQPFQRRSEVLDPRSACGQLVPGREEDREAFHRERLEGGARRGSGEPKQALQVLGVAYLQPRGAHRQLVHDHPLLVKEDLKGRTLPIGVERQRARQ